METTDKSFLIFISVAIFFVVNIYLTFLPANPITFQKDPVDNENGNFEEIAELGEVVVARPNIRITGKYLAKIEIWVLPANYKPGDLDYEFIGIATKIIQKDSGEQEWVYEIPKKYEKVKEILVDAYNDRNEEVDKRAYSYNPFGRG